MNQPLAPDAHDTRIQAELQAKLQAELQAELQADAGLTMTRSPMCLLSGASTSIILTALREHRVMLPPSPTQAAGPQP